ncbi:uncharacterized protein [Montipora capricornis]|uniref:uncharacterized protein n=1 Tax=Montipora capricornis TaxID=246305 RepID=UPI0035F19EC4
MVVLSGDKDSSVVIMQRADYVNKLETMIEEGITNGKYMVTEDNTLKDLKYFQDFLTRNFKSSLPLNKNGYSIKSTTDFAERLSNRTVDDDDEVLVSYDVSSLFTEVPLGETIDHIIHEIYTYNKLPQLSSKLLFRRLLCNVTKNTVFSFNGKLYKQIDGCGMGNPLSPVLANIFMAKLEADVIRPLDPPFYDRYSHSVMNVKIEPDVSFGGHVVADEGYPLFLLSGYSKVKGYSSTIIIAVDYSFLTVQHPSIA